MKNRDLGGEYLDEIWVTWDHPDYDLVQNQGVSRLFQLQCGNILTGLLKKLHYGRISRRPFGRLPGSSEARFS